MELGGSWPTSWARINSCSWYCPIFGWPCKPIGYGSVRHLEIELPELLAEAPTAANAIP